ncbi:MAG: hypothetical protein GDA36_08125 [Rhodobacteraceae bacterium]|nr:hypothetical protein [Paracoccaceae bacterium]
MRLWLRLRLRHGRYPAGGPMARRRDLARGGQGRLKIGGKMARIVRETGADWVLFVARYRKKETATQQ